VEYQLVFDEAEKVIDELQGMKSLNIDGICDEKLTWFQEDIRATMKADKEVIMRDDL
jgi:hypothetical protein